MILPNRMARRYNAGLKNLVLELNKSLDGATYVFANVYDLVMEVTTNHKKYGRLMFQVGTSIGEEWCE